MPHVILKMLEGRTEEQKQALADALTKAVTTTLGCGEDLVSVGIEDFREEEWMGKVYGPDIRQRSGTIYKMPGYGPEG
jgi:4-oxalocrotonate tautomerase